MIKFLRYLAFLPVTFVILTLIYFFFGLLLYWIIGLSTFWLLVVLFLFGGMIWGLFKGIAGFAMGFTSKISPSFEFAFWTILILTILNCIWSIYGAWTIDVSYSGKIIFGAIVYTLLIIELTFALIVGSISLKD